MSYVDKIRADNQKMQQEKRAEFILYYALSFHDNLSQHAQFSAFKKQLSDAENHDTVALFQKRRQGPTKIPKTIWHQWNIITGLSKLADKSTEQFTDYEFAATLLLFSRNIVQLSQEGEYIRRIVQQIMYHRDISLSGMVDIQQIKDATQAVLDHFELFLSSFAVRNKQNSTQHHISATKNQPVSKSSCQISNSIGSYLKASKTQSDHHTRPQTSKTNTSHHSSGSSLCSTCASNNRLCIHDSHNCPIATLNSDTRNNKTPKRFAQAASILEETWTHPSEVNMRNQSHNNEDKHGDK